ncbi:ATPase domain-containing protein [Elusimicrobiota bacterium]
MQFECVECGYGCSKWLGKCPGCSAWNTIVEVEQFAESSPDIISKNSILKSESLKLTDIKIEDLERIPAGISGIDRILGGGMVKGEVVLLGGPPGVGKSTLFLQLAGRIACAGNRVLFVSGEENALQVKMRADRLGIDENNITVMSSGDFAEIEKMIREEMPFIVFIDSIQTVVDNSSSGTQGSIKQVKHCGQKLTVLAKNTGTVIFISGQITKQGEIAGPKVLEHMVDAVLYISSLESNERMINAVKNRFGASGDYVLLNITKKGLIEVGKRTFDENRHSVVIGQSTSCIRVGLRLVPVELQALVAGSYFEYPLRRVSGYSRERLLMICAILEKHLSLKLGSSDVYLNISGGNRVEERISDLAVASSIVSCYLNIPVSKDVMFIGELNLSGEIRSVKDIEDRLNFAVSNNYTTIVVPGRSRSAGIDSEKIKIISINSISELENVLNNLKIKKEYSKTVI